ncbi:tyrosine-protein phosphatase non-receptor type 13 isoform X2 [Patella vulgata]|uniref:tyrosine-protein phosphatase non-receptor type 13 isoform X2 n=1 Tax=Patella vulgata TaxID=6465 RepID=UPI00217FD786|nr:tyrosine-protein phosphatase non-receptor type 13 isoform X2 [Patella vulgata]
MSSSEIPVSLAEALEIRGSALTENEAWGVLSQTAESVQDLFIKGKAFTSEGLNFVLTPDTLLLNSNGHVSFIQAARLVDSSYIAPEYQDGNLPSSDGAVDKMYVYSLGRTLHNSTQYKLTQTKVPKLSHNLESLFGAMCETDPNHRLALVHVLEACTIHAQKKSSRTSSSNYVIRLHQMVLGGSLNYVNMFDSSYGSDISSLTTSTQTSRRRRSRDDRRRKTSHRSRSRSRSRSGSGSRNNGVTNESEFRLYRRKSNPDRDSGIGTLREADLNARMSQSISEAQSSYVAAMLTHDGEENSAPYTTKQTTLPSNVENQLPKGLDDQYSQSQYPVGYEKYLRLKERQRRLRAIRGRGDDRPLSFRQPGNHENIADSKSLHSMMSYTAGTYMPDLHPQYGSEVAYRLGQGSDQDSMFSSDLSMMADHNTLRASKTTINSGVPVAPVRKKRVKQVTTNPPVNRDFVGPEFVHFAVKPPIRIPMPLQGESLKNPSHARRVIIVHLTGQKYEVICDPSTNGRQLFDVLVTHIGLAEYYYFGLTFIAESEHFFIDPDTKLHKVAPDGWKETVKGQIPIITFTVYVRVKFYMDSITDIRHDSSYHLMYLQLRRDIIEDRFYCTDDQALALAGLALQVEFGDYNPATMTTGYFVPEQYFSTRMTRKLGMQYLRDHAKEMHQNLQGHPSSQSELEFIKCIQKLPEYGIHYHKLLKNKHDSMSTVWVGISSRNLVIAENQGHERIIVQRHPWQSTQKISFNKRRFSVQPKPDIGTHIAKPPKINLYCNTYRKGRYLLQISTAQHRFQMRMRTRPSNTETIHGQEAVAGASVSLGLTSAGVMEDYLIDDRISVDNRGVSSASAYDSSFDAGSIGFVADTRSQEPPLKYRSPPPYRPGLSYSLDDLRDPSLSPLRQPLNNNMAASNMELHRPVAVHGNLHVDRSLHDDRYHSGLRREEEETQSFNNSINSSNVDQTEEALLSAPSRLGPRVTEVTLRKEEHHGIGMTIVGGKSTEKLGLGIFVKTVVPRGPAYRSGYIFPGDRIVAINDNRLEGVEHRGAVQMIRDSGVNVKLLIAQARAPPTLRRKHLEQELSDELDAELDEIARSYEDIYTSSLSADLKNNQLSRSMDNLGSNPGSNPPIKPPRGRKTKDLPPVNDLMRELSQTGMSYPRTDHVIVQPSNHRQEQKISVKADIEHLPLTPEDIISGNLVYRDQSSLVSTIDVHEEAARPDNLDLLLDESNNSQELEIVGEIAEMSIHDSSSDSDFDSAIYDVIMGKPKKNGRLQSQDEVDHIDTGQDRDKLPTASKGKVLLKSVDDFYFYVTEDNTYEVDLVKGTNGLGFSIQGGVDVHPTDPAQCVPRVKKVFMLGPAAESQVIRAGDVILQVQDTQLRGLTRNEIIEMMHTTPKEVKLIMCRPDSGILPPIMRGDSVDSLEALLHSPQTLLSASMFLDNQDSLSESDDETIQSDRSSPPIPIVNRIQNHPNDLVYSPNNQTLNSTTPVLRRSWTDQNIVVLSSELSSRDSSGILLRSQSEQNALSPNTSTSPIAADTKKYFREEKKSDQVSSAVRSPYGNFENLAMLGWSDDQAAQDTSDAGSAWSDDEPVTRETLQSIPNNETDSYRSPKIEPRNSTLLSDIHEIDLLEGNSQEVKNESRKQLSPLFHSSASDPIIVNNREQDVRDKMSICSLSPVNSPREATLDGSKQGETTLNNFTFSSYSVDQYKRDNESSEDENQRVVTPEASRKGEITVSRNNSDTNSESSITNKTTVKSNIPPYLRRQDKVQVMSDDEQLNVNSDVENNKQTVNCRDNKVHDKDLSVCEDDVHPQDFEVTLRKRDGGGLGFAVAGSGQSMTGCYIKDVLQDPALSDGRLQPGDQLIEVNGECMLNMNHFEAVTLLRQAPTLVRIKARRPSGNSPQNPRVAGSVQTKTTGAMKNQQLSQPIDKNEVDEVGEGRRKERVQDIETIKMGVKDMIKSLENRKISLTPGDSDTDSRSSDKSEGGIIRIKLSKCIDEGYGFSLITADRGNTTGVYVKTIKGGGVAYKDGRLQVGDRLIQVNDESVIGLNHSKVISMLRDTRQQVQLTVARSGRLSNLEEVTKDSQSQTSKPANEEDSFTRLIDPANETDEDINAMAGDAKYFLKQNGNLNSSNISLLTPRDASHDVDIINYKSPRKIPIAVPEALTDDWLESIPVLSISEDGEDFISDVLHLLVEKVEQEEPYEEFKNLRLIKATDECLTASLPKNKLKNRYRNVLPYDCNRVMLNGTDDYINASHVKIDVGDSQLCYIMCQGPLPNTVDDFWLMCWQQHVSVIAMLTLDIEDLKVKCHKYWPELEENNLKVLNGQYEVSCESKQRLNDFIIRYIKMEDMTSGRIHRIVHLNYTTWPDHGTPDTALPLLQYLRLIHLFHTGGPVVVHCSAGIGRSGSLVTIDTALLNMENMKHFQIYDIVSEVRQQRYGVIQTKDQYMFCYTACMQALLSVAS